MGKLNKALNNVSFRDQKLFANVAKFDRFGRDVGSSVRKGDEEKILEKRERKMMVRRLEKKSREEERSEVVKKERRKKNWIR